MKTAAKIFVVLLIFALSSCADPVETLEVENTVSTPIGEDDDIDCKGNC